MNVNHAVFTNDLVAGNINHVFADCIAKPCFSNRNYVQITVQDKRSNFINFRGKGHSISVSTKLEHVLFEPSRYNVDELRWIGVIWVRLYEFTPPRLTGSLLRQLIKVLIFCTLFMTARQPRLVDVKQQCL